MNWTDPVPFPLFIDGERWARLLTLITQPDRKHTTGGFQNRRRKWRERTDEAARSITLDADDVDFIRRQIINQHAGGFQRGVAKIFTDLLPEFTGLPILPRPKRPRQKRHDVAPDLPQEPPALPADVESPTRANGPAMECVTTEEATATMQTEQKFPDNVNSLYAARYKKVRTEVRLCSPEEAKGWRTDCLFERQRPIVKANVERLGFEVRKGWFVAGTPVFVCVLPDGSMKLVNGNHTMEAIIATGIPVPLTFVYLECRNIEEVADVYANLDVHRARNWRNALQAHGVIEKMPIAQHVMAAIALIMADFTPGNFDPLVLASRTARIAELEKYESVATLIADLYRDKSKEIRRLLLRAAALAVTLETVRYQPSAAMEFWGAAVADNGLVKGDPAKAMLVYLRNHQARGGRNDQIEQATAVALAWNAFYSGRSLEVCRPNSAGEFRLLGTRFHAGATKAREEAAAVPPVIETGMVMTEHGPRTSVRAVRQQPSA